MNKKLKLMSMEELSRLAKNEGEDETLRHAALDVLHKRERKFAGRIFAGSHAPYYVPGL